MFGISEKISKKVVVSVGICVFIVGLAGAGFAGYRLGKREVMDDIVLYSMLRRL